MKSTDTNHGTLSLMRAMRNDFSYPGYQGKLIRMEPRPSGVDQFILSKGIIINYLNCTAICRVLSCPDRQNAVHLVLRMEATMASVKRAERLEVRTTSAQKRLIERAAELRGTSVTDFVVSNIQAAAAETIREFESLFLRDEAREVFVKALLNPPEPNEALKAAAARHKQMVL